MPRRWTVIALGLGLASIACKRSTPSEAIRSDQVSTADAALDATSKKVPAGWARLGSFALPTYGELIGLSGERFRVHTYVPGVDGAGPKAVYLLDSAGAIVTRRDALPEMIAFSFDGRLQFVVSAAGTQRVDVDTHVKAPWKKPGFPEAISDDLKLVVTTDLDVYELSTEKRICHLAPPFAGGAEGVYRFEAGSRFLTMANGRASYLYDPIACKGDPIPIGQRFRISADGNVVVEIPHDQFAVGWSDAFVVVDGKTGDKVRTLPLKIPELPPDPDAEVSSLPLYDAALTPTGDRLIVVHARELIVVRVSDGKELHREGVADLVAKGAEVTVVASMRELAIASAGKVTRFSLPASP